ncbi:MAG: NAD(P)/FAD-dependent oxidoreductase [Armatimonadota bacterium]|nr:NAD(P)/FAD-dependent oxidoreductase [Armatimonadota bacterium]
MAANPKPRVVILGGGFGGLYAAKSLAGKPVEVTLVDRRNFHLFQPLLYQVATGTLSPGDIAFPLRSVLKKARNIRVLLGEVVGIDLTEKCVLLQEGSRLAYDYLIVALGSTHSYFNHPEWETHAPPLKSMENALEMRSRIFSAFESAELEPDPEMRKAWLTFTIVGGGSTGVELAGTLAEIAKETLREDFRSFDPGSSRIIVVEAESRILPSYPEKLSRAAENAIRDLGIEVRTKCLVTEITSDQVLLQSNGATEVVPCRTTLWGAGVGGSPLGAAITNGNHEELDHGRVIVGNDLSIASHPEVFVVGDLSSHPSNLPGVAQVAIQGGQHAARTILNESSGKPRRPFVYRDKGNLSVIGRNSAVAQIGRFQFSGFLAWFIWAIVHIAYLIGFKNKFLVMFQWAWNYWFFNRSARLITTSREP